MTIEELSRSFWGHEVTDFDPAVGLADRPRAVRIGLDWEQYDNGVTFSDLFARLRADPHVGGTEALIIGDWGGAAEGNDCEAVVQALVAAREQLAALGALFVGEMVCEQCEISWIHLADMSPLWSCYPKLEHFRVRGMQGLSLGRLAHPGITNLTIETGGMPPDLLAETCRAELPALDHLELWLGDDEYGWSSEVDELAPILDGSSFPGLRYLGLRNSCVADDVARAVAVAPVLRHIEVLDLSLGTLTDAGVDALASSLAVPRLQKIDIHHHFASEEAVARLRATGVEVNADDPQQAEEYGGEVYRYVAVSE